MIDCKTCEHGEKINYPHNKVLGCMNHPKDEDFTDIVCDGLVVWDAGIEGLVCSKCELYTGIK